MAGFLRISKICPATTRESNEEKKIQDFAEGGRNEKLKTEKGEMRKLKTLLTIAAVALTATFTSCVDEESALGIGLADTTLLYNGQTDTLYADQAWTEFEDSLLTSNYSYGIIGNYSDNVFGKVSSVLYTQIALSANSTNISFGNELVIDSVVLSLTKSALFPDTGGVYNFHFEVKQLAEALVKDSLYYASSTLPVDENAVFFDDDVRVSMGDTIISLRLNPSFYPVIHRTATAEEFIEQTKGLRIRITDAGDAGMVSIDFSSATTCLRTYYHYTEGSSTSTGFYTFLMGAGTSHFTHFEHNYSGTVFASGDKVTGSFRLYLEPLGGQQIRMSFDRDLQAFHAAHPWAVIHHAEIILPLAPETPTLLPDQIITLGREGDSTDAYINDLIDLYTLSGYDGSYHEDGNYYRIRATQHVQGLLRQGNDPGFLFVLNSRRHSAQRAIFNGLGTTNRPRIILVYSE